MQIQYYTNDTWHGTCSTITLYKTVTYNGYDADSVARSNNHSVDAGHLGLG
jgi:hypothetical protein